jgi:DNA-binding transcriptional ArsR family regulator
MKSSDFDVDELLRALAHPDRRQFLVACFHESRPAGELARLSKLSLATVSEHLKVLRKVGLLVLTKQGRFWYYRTDPKALAVVKRLTGLLTRGHNGS